MPDRLEIHDLSADAVRDQLDALAEILAACVAAGASVSFMAPFSHAEARAVFEGYAAEIELGQRLLLAACLGEELLGTVQLILALPPNQPHRAEVAKLLVHPRARRQGIAAALMLELEQQARREGRTLLVLDTVSGGDAERLYRRLGWSRVGVIPDYALFPDGRPCDTTVFCKPLAAASGRAAPARRPGVRLVPLAPAHLTPLAGLVADPLVERFTRLRAEPAAEVAANLLARYREGAESGSRAGFAIELGEAGFAGVALAPTIDRAAATAELGYLVAPAFRGRGVAGEALELLCVWAFTELGLVRLELMIDPENVASRRVAERCGFVKEGLLGSLHVKGEIRRDTELWSRLRDDQPEP